MSSDQTTDHAHRAGADIRGRAFALLGASVLCAQLLQAGEVFDSLLTMDAWDAANTAEYPRNTDANGGFPHARTREDGLARALHIRLPLSPHATWRCAETIEKARHLRIAFKEPLRVGTLIGGAGAISFLRPDASAAGDVASDDQWIAVPVVEGQAGLRVAPFPPGVTTRALRLTFDAPPANGLASHSGIGGLLMLRSRLHNLTPEATAFASSQVAGDAQTVEAHRVQNLVTGGAWSAAPKQDISPGHPAWVVLAWPTAHAFRGVGFVDAFAKTLEVDVLAAGEQGHPATAPESSWTRAGSLPWPIWWRPAYTDAYLPFREELTTRAIRIRITEPLTDENEDIKHRSGGGRRSAGLAGVMCFTDLGDRPVPPRPRAAADPPPLKIPYAMPCDGRVAMVIDDAKGRRVRNLLAEAERASGPQVESWDGRDDAGKMLPPGSYTWKAVTHAPLHLSYQATVNCSGNPPWWKSRSWGDQSGPGSWLSDHFPPNDVTAIGDRMFIGAALAESGHTILACDLDGNKLWGAKWLETAGAGFLANDGKRVYSLGEGGWLGNRLYIHEIDPQTFAWRRVTQLVFDSGGSRTAGATGIAARDGKLYVAFNRPARPWTRSALATQDIDLERSSPASFGHGGDLYGLLRTAGNPPPHGQWQAVGSADGARYLRLAFRAPQAVGCLVSAAAGMQVSALAADAPFPGDPAHDEQWIPFTPAAQGRLQVHTAPPRLTTRALRFSFAAAGDKARQAHLAGALVLARRFTDIAGTAAVAVSSGEIKAGVWRTVRTTPITRDDPAIYTMTWPTQQTFRCLGLLGCFAKQVEVDAFIGASGTDPSTAPATSWAPLGSLAPAVRWRAGYRDDYFDAGRDVTTRGIRLRIVAAWTDEDIDIKAATGGKPLHAGLDGVAVLRHLGDDPASGEVPTQRIDVVDAATGRWERSIPVPMPRFPHFDAQGRLAAVSGRTVVRIDLADGRTTPLVPSGLEDPRGIAFGADGGIFVVEGATQVIKAFSPSGTLLRTIADPGGRQLGAYDRRRLANPQGLAVDGRGRLWIAEADAQPKRTSVWTADGTYVTEYIGPAGYGGGGFLDPKDPSRLYYGGMEFAIDWRSRSSELRNILCRSQPAFGGMHASHPIHLGGRRYMVNDPGTNGDSSGSLLLVGEYLADRVIPRTVMGNADLWRPFAERPELAALVAGRPLTQYSFLWADRDGDGLPQPSEIALGPEGLRLDASYWPTRVSKDLAVFLGNRLLRPAGFTACGAPLYQPFTTAALGPIPSKGIYAFAVDGQGRVLVNGDPVLALAADGSVDWTYPQHWVGVHASQRAPSPQPGQLIGGLGFIGQELVPGLGETFMLSGNKGEWYLFTTDGILAATIWHDYRQTGITTWNFPKADIGMPLDRVTLGEEHFGGCFVQAPDGRFYLIAGHNHNSVVELGGLDTMRRQSGTLAVSAQDIAAAEAWGRRQALTRAEREAPRVVDVGRRDAPPAVDGKLDDWQEAAFQPIGDRGAFAVSWDATDLHVAFRVTGGRALANGGDDPHMLFKTGDSVNLEIGADGGADPRRTAPVPGDQRLLLTLLGGKPVGVLYKHRVPGTPDAARTAFASPWRAEYVDAIVRLDPTRIAIARTPQGYAVEASVPLALLGLAPRAGASHRLDAGILTGDSSGGATLVRTYWSNANTGVVSDVPSEIALTPALWGTAVFR